MKYLSLLLIFLISFSGNAQEYFPKNDGVKQSFKNYVAITNANIYVAANQKIEKATLLIKENKIIEVGTNISIPKGATIVDATGKTIYPSFVELYSEFGITNLPQDQVVTSHHNTIPIVKVIIGTTTSNQNTMHMKT